MGLIKTKTLVVWCQRRSDAKKTDDFLGVFESEIYNNHVKVVLLKTKEKSVGSDTLNLLVWLCLHKRP